MKKGIKNIINIKLDTSVYPLEAIYSAAYVFLDKVYIYLDSADSGKNINVNLKSKNNKDIESLKGEFLNELLHSVHRMHIYKNNKKIREYIVERALFSSVDENNNDDFDDPLGIAVPWEEKYGDKQ